jgi:hypothetical protein
VEPNESEAIMLPVEGYQLSHSNIAIGPAPHRSLGRREHCSTVLASIAVIPGMNKIVSNRPSSHPADLNLYCYIRSTKRCVTNHSQQSHCEHCSDCHSPERRILNSIMPMIVMPVCIQGSS